jgi:hypothetical protein
MIATIVSGALLLVLLAVSQHLEHVRGRILLWLLIQDGRPTHVLDLVVAGASGRGIVCIVLSALEAEGLIRSIKIHCDAAGRIVDRVYELTGTGRAVAYDLRRERKYGT